MHRTKLEQDLQALSDKTMALGRVVATAIETAVTALAERDLAQARVISDPGPRLQKQLAALAERIESARQPVPVQLRSDGQTTVTIFKVGELGRFQARTVGLIPGRYTAVGARSGYRDVRREFVVQAGAASTELTIVCEDPV